MKITIENTDKIVEVNGLPTRIWEGQTDSGAPVACWIALISPQTHDPEVNAQFERELEEVRPAKVEVYDMRYFID